MSNLGDLIDAYEQDRLAQLKTEEAARKARWDALPQATKDKINGVNAMIDEDDT